LSSYDFSVDMSGYVPLVKRFSGACRCPTCLSNPEIAKFYVNDVTCRHDGSLCDRFFSGIVHCFERYRGRVRRCPRDKGFRRL